MQDQTPPGQQPEKRVSALRGWPIKIGLAALPHEETRYKKAATEQQKQAKQGLTWHMLRPPRM